MRRYALVSVSDYTGLLELCQGLSSLGFSIVASSGNADYLEGKGVKTIRIQTITKYEPMMMPKGIKNIHHKIFADILADRSDPEHMRELRKHRIRPFDIVVCNFYPFGKVAADPRATDKKIMQNVDVGGPAMVRCAAKNYRNVVAIVDHGDYGKCLKLLRESGAIPLEMRRRLALKAFEHARMHDGEIIDYMKHRSSGRTGLGARSH